MPLPFTPYLIHQHFPATYIAAHPAEAAAFELATNAARKKAKDAENADHSFCHRNRKKYLRILPAYQGASEANQASMEQIFTARMMLFRACERAHKAVAAGGWVGFVPGSGKPSQKDALCGAILAVLEVVPAAPVAAPVFRVVRSAALAAPNLAVPVAAAVPAVAAVAPVLPAQTLPPASPFPALATALATTTYLPAEIQAAKDLVFMVGGQRQLTPVVRPARHVQVLLRMTTGRQEWMPEVLFHPGSGFVFPAV